MRAAVPSALLLGGLQAAMAPSALRFYRALRRPEVAQAECLARVLRAVAGSKQAAPGPTYQLLIARSNAVPVDGAAAAGERPGRLDGTRAC